MNKKEFIQKIKESLEINEDILEETNLVELMDSLSLLSLLSLVDEKFQKQFSHEEIQRISTVKSLINMIGEEKFN